VLHLNLQQIAIGIDISKTADNKMNAEQNNKEKDDGVQSSSNDTEYDNEGDDDDLSISKLFDNEQSNDEEVQQQQQQQQSKSNDKVDTSKKEPATTSKSTLKKSNKRPADKVSNSSSTKKPAAKKRKRSQSSTKQSTTATSQLTPSRQRMDEALNKCTKSQKELQRALAALEKAKTTVSTCRLNFINTKKLVESVAKEECEELLKESSQWNDMYHKLKKYKSINGHCNVKQNVSRNFDGEVKDDLNKEMVKQLSSWVGKIRKEYKQQQKRISESITTIDNEEIVDTEPYKSIALDNIGFQYDPRSSKWLAQYQELKRYKAQHGDTLVKHSNSGIGAWVKRQQVQYTLYCKGDETKSDLTAERVQLLNDLGFVWSRRTNTWNEQFDRLVKWKETHGNCHMIPDKSTDPEVAQLHKWVADQRVHYKQDKNSTDKQDCIAADSSTTTTKNSKKKKAPPPKLSQDKIDKLKGIGFEFDARDAKWLQKFDVLLKYKQRHGDFLVPSNYQEDLSLSNWVANQRAQYNLYMKGSKSHMTERRLKILTDAGFPFSATEDNQQQEKNQEEDKVKFDAKSWIEKYRDLLLHVATHGTLDSLQASNPLLAEWEASQRALPTASTTASFKQKDDENVMNKEKELMSAARLFLSLQGSSK